MTLRIDANLGRINLIIEFVLTPNSNKQEIKLGEIRVCGRGFSLTYKLYSILCGL